MLKIAITGNIASGKSLFENFLKERGYKVLCLDCVTHFLYENSTVLQEFLLKKFNTKTRKEIADIVFQDVVQKKELEDFIYPLILNEMNAFFAAGFDKYFDKTLLITTDKNIRLQRLMKRNGLTETEALSRINSQMREEVKKELSDYVIDNSLDIGALELKADDFIKEILQEH